MEPNDQTRAGLKLIPVGVSGILLALPFLLWAAYLAPPELSGSLGPIPVVSVDISVQWIPEIGEPDFDAGTWFTEILVAVGQLLLAGIYYVALAVGAVGTLSTLFGFLLVGNPELIGSAIRQWTSHWVVRLLVGVYLLFGAAVFVPGLLVLLVELSVAFLVGGTLLALFGAGWLRFRARSSPFVRIAVAYPLGVAAVVLPVVATALVSPTFAAATQVASEQLAILILDTVLSVGGVNEWIRATFDLEGANYFLMWLGIAVSVGWLLGAGVELAVRDGEAPVEDEPDPR